MKTIHFLCGGCLILVCASLLSIGYGIFKSKPVEKEPSGYIDPELELIHSSTVVHSLENSKPIITYYTNDNPWVYNQDPVFISRGMTPQEIKSTPDKLIISNTIRNDFDRRQK